MIPAADARRLQSVYRDEFRSLLQYLREAAPYTPVADRPLRDTMLRIAKEEASELDSLGEQMEAHRVDLPPLGSYPVAFTDLNFTTVRHFLPKLIAEQKRDMVRLDLEASHCTDFAARAILLRLVELHQRHLKELESLG